LGRYRHSKYHQKTLYVTPVQSAHTNLSFIRQSFMV
jgi:hypothetical protein